MGRLGLTKYRLWQKRRQLTLVYILPEIGARYHSFPTSRFRTRLLAVAFVTLKLTHKSVDILSAVLHDSCIDLHVGRAS